MDRVQGNGGSQRGIGSKDVGSLYGEYKGLFNYPPSQTRSATVW